MYWAFSIRARLTSARLEALRMQLNPHFLFNTLHTISTKAEAAATTCWRTLRTGRPEPPPVECPCTTTVTISSRGPPALHPPASAGGRRCRAVSTPERGTETASRHRRGLSVQLCRPTSGTLRHRSGPWRAPRRPGPHAAP
ncbi:MAG: histidine kinase [Salinivenus sp.]